MQPGDLVRITRAFIGVPVGTIGLIVKVRPYRDEHGPVPDSYLYFVQRAKGPLRRYLAQDLRKVR